MQSEKRKQFLLLAGVPILYYSLAVLSECDRISSIVLMVPKEDLAYMTEQEKITQRFPKIQAVLVGGKERQDTVYAALDYLSRACPAPDLVVVHDAVRPFAEKECFADVISAASRTGAAIAAVPVQDTIKQADVGTMFVRNTEPRESLWAAQTPQCFSFPVLWAAHQEARRYGFKGTDDAELVEKTGIRVSLVMGSYDNIKITTPTDLEWGNYRIQSKGGNQFESGNRL